MNRTALPLAVSLVLNLALVGVAIVRQAGADGGAGDSNVRATARSVGGELTRADGAPTTSTQSGAMDASGEKGRPSARELAAFFGGEAKEVMARLQAARYPVRYQSGIAQAFVNLQFEDRFNSLPGYLEAPPFWKTNVSATTVVNSSEYRAIRDEMGKAREAILGDVYSTTYGFMFLDDPSWIKRQGFEGLPVEKMEAIWKGMKEGILPAAILTPEELFAYNLRRSPTANALRNSLQGLDYSEEQFIAMYRIREPFDLRWTLIGLTPEQQRQKQEELDRVNAEIAAVLAREQAAAFEYTNDPRYQSTLLLTEKLALPKAAAAQAVAVQRDLQQKLTAAYRLPESEQSAELSRLAGEAESRFVAILGAPGFAAYRSDATLGLWMSTLPATPAAK